MRRASTVRLILLAGTLLAGACETQTPQQIAGVDQINPAAGAGSAGLSELAVLGIDPKHPPKTQDAAAHIADFKKVGLHKGESVLVIQAGAALPDEAMLKELAPYVHPLPFSGLAAEGDESYAAALRTAAARSGAGAILCYWGAYDASAAPMKLIPASAESPAPPQPAQHLRLRLKVALVDVASGNWTTFAIEPEGEGTSPDHVAELKAGVYHTTAHTLASRYLTKAALRQVKQPPKTRAVDTAKLVSPVKAVVETPADSPAPAGSSVSLPVPAGPTVEPTVAAAPPTAAPAAAPSVVPADTGSNGFE